MCCFSLVVKLSAALQMYPDFMLVENKYHVHVEAGLHGGICI